MGPVGNVGPTKPGGSGTSSKSGRRGALATAVAVASRYAKSGRGGVRLAATLSNVTSRGVVTKLTTPEVGFGSFEAEEVLLATFRIPPSVVAQAVARSTRSAEHPEGFDILAPFRLPYAAKRVRLQPGKALLEF